jgi:hypothetical protein
MTRALVRISTSFPEMCKWNAFAIDTWRPLCKYEQPVRENFYHFFLIGRMNRWLDERRCLR